MAKKLIYELDTYILRGILFKIHNNLGRFRSERQYADAFEQTLKEKSIQYEREKILNKSFPGEKANRCRIDFLIKEKIIIELKVKPRILNSDYSQCQRYLCSLNLNLCLLVNFRPRYLAVRRILNYRKYNKEKIIYPDNQDYP